MDLRSAGGAAAVRLVGTRPGMGCTHRQHAAFLWQSQAFRHQLTWVSLSLYTLLRCFLAIASLHSPTTPMQVTCAVLLPMLRLNLAVTVVVTFCFGFCFGLSALTLTIPFKQGMEDCVQLKEKYVLFPRKPASWLYQPLRTHTHTYTHTHMHAHAHTRTHTRMYTHTHTRTCTHSVVASGLTPTAVRCCSPSALDPLQQIRVSSLPLPTISSTYPQPKPSSLFVFFFGGGQQHLIPFVFASWRNGARSYFESPSLRPPCFSAFIPHPLNPFTVAVVWCRWRGVEAIWQLRVSVYWH